VHDGAVYLHLGRSYLVRELDLQARHALLEPFDGGYFTKLGWDRYQNVGDAGSTGKGSINTYQLGVGLHF